MAKSKLITKTSSKLHFIEKRKVFLNYSSKRLYLQRNGNKQNTSSFITRTSSEMMM